MVAAASKVALALVLTTACASTVSTPPGTTSTTTSGGRGNARTVRIGAINTLPLVARWDSSTRGSSRAGRVRGFRTAVLDRWTPVPYVGFIPVPDDSALA